VPQGDLAAPLDSVRGLDCASPGSDDRAAVSILDSAGAGRRVLIVAGGVVAGAAVIAAIWWSAGGGGAASGLEQDPGVPPPDYVYLDNARVVLYLGQIEGGLSKSETLTKQLTQNQNATVAASGFQLGGSSGQSSSVERVVTPTATARFYRLLDRLQAHGYLRTIDANAQTKVLARAFVEAPEGTFVRLRNCRLQIPSYVRFGQLLRASRGRMAPFDALLDTGTSRSVRAEEVLTGARFQAGRIKAAVGGGLARITARDQRRLAAAAPQLVQAVGPNARVPVSCAGAVNPRAHGLDLLFPIRLGDLSPDHGLLAGPVTVVGKLVHAVRRRDDAYVDSASLAYFDGPVGAVNAALPDTFGGLDADVTVLAPGAVVQPIAIYK
jgi:hypothetical protein